MKYSKLIRNTRYDKMLMTPTLAITLIEISSNVVDVTNRPINPTNKARIVKSILDGNWIYNNECIVTIAKNGLIMGGNHTLHACVESGISIHVDLSFYVFPFSVALMAAMGEGKSWTYSDMFAAHFPLNDPKHMKLISECMARLFGYYETTAHGRKTTSNLEMIQYVESSPKMDIDLLCELAEIILDVAKVHRPFQAASALFIYYIAARINRTQADDFMTKLYAGRRTEIGDPELATANAIKGQLVRHGKIYIADFEPLVMQAWNKRRAGEFTKRVHYNKNLSATTLCMHGSEHDMLNPPISSKGKRIVIGK